MAGYDSRPLTSGDADTGVNVTNKRTAFFQQLALQCRSGLKQLDIERLWTDPCR